MNQLHIILLTAIVTLTGATACVNREGKHNPNADNHSTASHEALENTAHQPSQEPSKHGADHENEHNHEGDDHEASDLERSVEELFSDQCEHNVHTYACDECRYEVGVVKVPSVLMTEHLISTTPISNQPLTDALRLTGEVQFDERRVTHVSTQVSGVIRKVFVTNGESVTAGQPLIEIESVEVGNARAALQEAAALEALARQNFDRTEALGKEGITSQKEVLHAKQELEAARIRAEAARGTLGRIGTGTASGNSGRLILKAPADGEVLTMHAVKGEVAITSDSLLTIGDNRTLWVWADLYEQDYANVLEHAKNKTLEARVFVKAFGDTGFPGTLDYISPSMDEQSRTIKIRIAVENTHSKLLAGMFADVDLYLPADGDAAIPAVPAAAILKDGDTRFVFIHHKDDYFVRRAVLTGRTLGNYTEIVSGIPAGSTVISDGAFLLKSDVLRSKMGAGCAH